tara:strand:- start:29116 stop:31092 length:1977 start_codon:yes stop_codon:yes gene_type:complete
MATITAQTFPMNWKAIPSVPSFTTINNNELDFTTNLEFAVLPAYNSGDNYEPEGASFSVTTTSVPTTSASFGNGLNISSETGLAVSDPTVLQFAGDFTHVIACRIPTVSTDQVIVEDWNTAGTERNYRLTIDSSYALTVELGDGSSNSNSASTSAGVVTPGQDYVIIFERDGSFARLWVYEEGGDFTYDPGDYDPTTRTGNNLGEHLIGVAPNDGFVSWEPLIEQDLTHTGGATSATPRLYSNESSGSAFTSPAVFSHLGYSRAISYQQAASHGFRPFRLFDAMDLTSDVTGFRGLSRYSDVGPKVYIGSGGGGPTYRAGLPSGLQYEHPNFINANWIQQSQVGAPGIADFIPMMGINPTNGPEDDRIITDTGSANPSGLRLGYRRVAFKDIGRAITYSNGMDGVANISDADLPLAVIDLEHTVTHDGGAENIEAPIGFFSYFQREEIGIELPLRGFGNKAIASWERPQNNWVSKQDLEDKADLAVFTQNGGMVCPFYWDYNLEPTENPGTDAVSRTDHLLTDSIFGGFKNRVRITRYMAEYADIPFWIAIRVDSAGNYSSQEVFDAQMELALRVGDGLSQFQGVYIWGTSASAAVERLNTWAFEGDAQGLYAEVSEGDQPMANPFPCRHPSMRNFQRSTATQPRTSIPWSQDSTTDC